jgi:hypothetical protein
MESILFSFALPPLHFVSFILSQRTASVHKMWYAVEFSWLPLCPNGQSYWLQIQGSGFDSRRYQIFWEVMGLQRGPLSLLSTIEELLERKSIGSGVEIRDYGLRDPSRWPHGTLYPQKLGLTSLTSGGCSVGIFRSRTQAMELVVFIIIIIDCLCGLVVRVRGYRSRGPGSIPGATRFSEKYRVWNEVHSASWVDLRSYEKKSGSGLENPDYGLRDPSRWPRGTVYPQKLAVTSPTKGGYSSFADSGHGVCSFVFPKCRICKTPLSFWVRYLDLAWTWLLFVYSNRGLQYLAEL